MAFDITVVSQTEARCEVSFWPERKACRVLGRSGEIFEKSLVRACSLFGQVCDFPRKLRRIADWHNLPSDTRVGDRVIAE